MRAPAESGTPALPAVIEAGKAQIDLDGHTVTRDGEETTLNEVAWTKRNSNCTEPVKQLEPNPWDGIQMKYSLGAEVTGEITNVTDFGVFVRLE